MAFAEKPPFLTGNSKADLHNLRDYLFRLAGSLDGVAQAPVTTANGVTISYTKDGQQVLKPENTVTAVQQSAQELKSLILKSASEVKQYADSKTEVYESMFVAQSDFGDFEETITAEIQTTASGVQELYNYAATIDSMQEDIDLLQQYSTILNGEIRRGILEDPDTHEYVLGIAISQDLSFTGQTCKPGDNHHPGSDSYTYYYIADHQTFGLYTATGWQFWVGGHKRGWYDSEDGTIGVLHVAGAIVETSLQIGTHWQIISDPNSNNLELKYLEV